MAMTANHLIMEGTTKSWFLKHEQPPQEEETGSECDLFDNFKYRVQYGAGSREYNQTYARCQAPAVLHSLVSCSNVASCMQHNETVRREHWDMLFDEGIRKYAPWSTPSSERVAVAAQDARLFGERPFRPRDHVEANEVSGIDSEKVYMEHQHDLAHRFNQGAVQLYDRLCKKTVGPINPYWMLRLPRGGQWRYAIDRVIGRTIAGTVCFIVENALSDGTVDDVLFRVDMNTAAGEGNSLHIVSSRPEGGVMALSDILLDSYPDPEVAHDGLSELTVTVVTQKEERPAPDSFMPMRRGAPISLFWGLIQLQK